MLPSEKRDGEQDRIYGAHNLTNETDTEENKVQGIFKRLTGDTVSLSN